LKNCGFWYGSANNSLEHIAIVGLDFYASRSDPTSPDFQPDKYQNFAIQLLTGAAAGTDDILLEDNRFRFQKTQVQIQSYYGSGPLADNIQIRRNVFTNAIEFGLQLNWTSNVLLEENVFDKSGWDNRDVFLHNVYIKEGHDYLIRGNILSRGGNSALKISGDHKDSLTDFVIENNLVYRGMIGLGHSAGPTGYDPLIEFSHRNGVIRNNVIMKVGKELPVGSGRKQAIGLNLGNLTDVVIEHNVFAHNDEVNASGEILRFAYPWVEKSANIVARDNAVWNWLSRHYDDNGTYVSFVNDVTDLVQTNNLTADIDYTDPGRTLESYHASIGGTGDEDVFLSAAAAMRKGSWDVRYTASAVNEYIRQGFTQTATAFMAPRSSGIGSRTNGNSISWDVEFSIPVAGVDATDFTLNFTPGAVTLTDAGDADPATYVLTATGIPEGTLQIDGVVENSGITNLDGNNLVPERQGADADHQFIVERVAPVPVISATLAGTNAVSEITVDFGEPVSGFDVTDLVISNGTASHLTTADSTVYTFRLTPDSDAAIAVNLPSGATTDIAGNSSSAAAQFDITSRLLTVDITRRDVNSHNTGLYRFNVNFDTAPQNVDATDFVVTSTGSVTADTSVTLTDAEDSDPTTWLATVTNVTGAGTIGLAMAGNSDIVSTASTALAPIPTVDESYHVVYDAYGVLTTAGRVYGNVTATISGNSVRLTGDTADNAVSIAATASGDIIIAGLNGTTINGQAEFVAFSSAGGVLPGNLTFTGSTGNEFLSIAGLSTSGSLVVSTGSGRDAVSLTAVTVGTDLHVRSSDVQLTHVASATTGGHGLFYGGTGNDQIELNNLNIGGVLSATTGDGADTVVLNRVDVASSTQLTTGSGDDIIQMIDSMHHGSFYAATEAGNDELRASGITAGATLYMSGGADNDLVDFYDISTQSTAVIATDAGNDVVRLLHSEIAQAAYLRFVEGTNVLDLQDSVFGGTVEGQTSDGTLTTRIRRNTFTAGALLLGGTGTGDVLLDDSSNEFRSTRNTARFEDTGNTLLNEPFSRLTESTLGTALIDDRHGLGVRTGRVTGNVTAVMSGPDLVITSDPGDNTFSVFANQAGDIVVRGRHGTTINGVTEFVALTGVGGVLPDDLRINGSAGDDLIEISGLTVTSDVFISTGDGMDGILVSYVNTGRDLQVNSGNGDSYVDLEHSIQNRHTIVTGGSGADLAVITAMDIRSVFSVNTGGGADRVVMNHTTTTSSTSVNTGTGDDNVRLIGTNHDGTLYITSDDGNNVLTGHDVRVAQTFFVALGINNNAVQMLNSVFSSVGIVRFAGGQNTLDLQANSFGGPTYLQATGGAMAARIRSNSFAGSTMLQGGAGSAPKDVLLDDGSNSFQLPAGITGFEDLSNTLIDELFEDILGLAFA
ncbi:MAG: Ig-like domain-containing protein, partial [Fuerstiella sp.]